MKLRRNRPAASASWKRQEGTAQAAHCEHPQVAHCEQAHSEQAHGERALAL